MEKVQHTLEPFYRKDSEILILGTMPSPKSRALGFYYMHKQNRFWKIMEFYAQQSLDTIEKKKDFLEEYKIALYDVLESCEIKGASDASIKKAKPTDLKVILDVANIKHIYTTGTKANQLFKKYQEKITGLKAIPLPSTSGANAKMSLDELILAYSIIFNGEIENEKRSSI